LRRARGLLGGIVGPRNVSTTKPTFCKLGAAEKPARNFVVSSPPACDHAVANYDHEDSHSISSSCTRRQFVRQPPGIRNQKERVCKIVASKSAQFCRRPRSLSRPCPCNGTVCTSHSFYHLSHPASQWPQRSQVCVIGAVCLRTVPVALAAFSTTLLPTSNPRQASERGSRYYVRYVHSSEYATTFLKQQQKSSGSSSNNNNNRHTINNIDAWDMGQRRTDGRTHPRRRYYKWTEGCSASGRTLSTFVRVRPPRF